MSVWAAPTLTLLKMPSMDDGEGSANDDDNMMELVHEQQQHNHHQQQQSDGERSPKSRNALGLTLPGSGGGIGTGHHSIDAMLGDDGVKLGANNTEAGKYQQHNHLHHPHRSPPRRIIHEVELDNSTMSSTLKAPPLICEQGPSAPGSPTSPSPASRSAKRPCPLSVDALQRLNLLSPNYVPNGTTMDAGGARLPPVSPSYPTSDLGSSPRSSISASHYTALGINASNWQAFRDAYTARRRSGGTMGGGSECGSEEAASGAKTGGGFLTPHQLLSPAPFSPFSDYGVADLHVGGTSVSGTPFSNRSPNLSPSPVRRAGTNLHFSFEQIRSRSSLSNPINEFSGAADAGVAASECHRRVVPPQSRALDAGTRERSRSEGETLSGGTGISEQHQRLEEQQQHDNDERMDTGDSPSLSPVTAATAGKTTAALPSTLSSSTPQLHAGQKRRRLLLHKSRGGTVPAAGDEEEEAEQQQCQPLGQSSPPGSNRQQQPQQQTLFNCSSQPIGGGAATTAISRKPTIEEPPPSPTLTELFQPGDLDKERRRQVEEWIRQQTAALEAFRHSLIPAQQEANLLQVPTIVPPNSLEHFWPSPPGTVDSSAGPIRPVSMWRRSRSESDVSAATEAAAATTTNADTGGRDATTAPASSTHKRRTSQQHAAHAAAPLLKIPLNEATHVCEHCGQGFSMHDRLSKHIASRHRDRSTSMNDENNRVHKCTHCPKSFGRSDMLTRHMRLHTGIRPYACQLCGQVFSRSDHLSTHQRTHTGEKPYQCPQCSYSASRRDMITRHMRTHLLLDGSSVPFPSAAELAEIPPISKLSLNPSPNASSTSGCATAVATPCGGDTATTPAQSPVPSAVATVHDEPAATATRSIVATTAYHAPPDPAPSSVTEMPSLVEQHQHHQQQQQQRQMENMLAAAKLLSSVAQQQHQQHQAVQQQQQHQTVQLQQHQAVQQQQQPARVPSLEGLLSRQMMLSTLHAQLPAHLRRSSPNLFHAAAAVRDYPSAFRPPVMHMVQQHHQQSPSTAEAAASAVTNVTATTTTTTIVDQHQRQLSPAVAAVALSSALSSVQQLLQQQQQQQQQQHQAVQQQQPQHLPPLLFRQHSFGGVGFTNQQLQAVQQIAMASAAQQTQPK